MARADKQAEVFTDLKKKWLLWRSLGVQENRFNLGVSAVWGSIVRSGT